MRTRAQGRRASEAPPGHLDTTEQDSAMDQNLLTPATTKLTRKRSHRRAQSERLGEESISVTRIAVTQDDDGVPNSKRVRLSNGMATPPSTVLNKVTGLTPGLHRATLSLATPDALVRRIQFQPLEEALSERTRRQLKRRHLSETINDIEDHKKEDVKKEKRLKEALSEISKLKLENEERRLGGIELNAEDEAKDDRIEQLLQEVQQLQQELEDMRHVPVADEVTPHPSSEIDIDIDEAGSAGPSSMDILHMSLIEPHDLDKSIEDMTPTSSFARRLTRTASSSPAQDPAREAEVRNFESEIQCINIARAGLESTLRNFTIELQSLGFTGPDAPADAVLAALRAAFYEARETVHDVVAEHEPNQLNNAEFLQLLTKFIRDQAATIGEYVSDIEIFEQENALLKGQYDGILTKLAESSHRANSLQEKWHNMDLELDEKEKAIVELEEANRALKDDNKEYTDCIAENQRRLGEYDKETEELKVSVSRLRKAADSYHNELSNAQQLFDRVQSEHAAEVANLQKIKDDAISDLEEKLRQETGLRESAQSDLSDKSRHIADLRSQLADAEDQLSLLKDQLAQAEADGEAERNRCEATKEDLEQKEDFIDSLEQQIRSLESTSEELTAEISSAQSQLETYRHQLMDAESELDQKSTEIAEITHKAKSAATQANEVRIQLFARQSEHERIVKELEDEAAAKEEQFQTDMADEISRREEANRLVAERDLAIADLKQKINDLENSRDELLAAKDAVEVEKNAQLEELRLLLEKATKDYEELTVAKEQEVTSLHNDISTLTTTLGQRSELVDDLQEESRSLARLRNEEVEERDGRIADLEDDLRIARGHIKDLEGQKTSLEQRVDDEAMHMLEVSNELSESLDAAKRDVKLKAERIRELQQDAAKAAEAHSVVVAEKNRDIENLEIVGHARAEDNKKLVMQVNKLKQLLRERVHSHAQTVKSIQQAYREAYGRGEALAEDSVLADKDALVELNAIEDVRTNFSNGTDGPEMAEVKTAVVKKQVSRKKTRAATRDSGIMMLSSDGVET